MRANAAAGATRPTSDRPSSSKKPAVDFVPSGKSLTATDLELVRVLEDLIGLLIDKNVIQLTELPQEAAAKLFRRRQLRGELDSLAGLVADEDQTF